jgi:hypothetical protein
MTERSIADQELFLPPEGQSGPREPNNTSAPSPRYYANLNDNADADHAESVDNSQRSGVPTFNVIEPTPSNSRSSTVRSSASHATEPKTMTGALPEVREEDDLYGAPSTGPTHPSVPQQNTYEPSHSDSFTHYEHSYQAPVAPYQAPHAPPQPMADSQPTMAASSEPWAHVPSANEGSFAQAAHTSQYGGPAEQPAHGQTTSYQAAGGSEPSASEQYQPSKEPPQLPPHPPTYDEDRAYRQGEGYVPPPPLPGPRPPVPTEHHREDDPAASAHPAVHLDSDQDYALALQLQEEEEGQAPPLPQRPTRAMGAGVGPSTALSSRDMSAEEQDRAFAMRLQEEEDMNAPALPIRPGQSSSLAPQGPKAFTRTPSTDRFLPPPRRETTDFGRDDPSDPVHYTRDPQKLTAYLIPFPIPRLTKAPSDAGMCAGQDLSVKLANQSKSRAASLSTHLRRLPYRHHPKVSRKTALIRSNANGRTKSVGLSSVRPKQPAGLAFGQR